MAAEVETMPGAGGRIRHAAYPWDLWLDGRAWHLTRGVDYGVKTRAMRAYAYRAGQAVGFRVATVRDADDNGITIRAVRPSPVAAAGGVPHQVA